MSEYCNNCFCCGYYLVPRYKRLVNNIFPPDVQHGLDKNNLERLRFYSVQKPEKLDKSFRYMSEKIARYLRHRDRPYVILGIKAMNDIMKSSYQQLNTFVNHYLETLHLVLEERNDLELTEHAIASFESFCEIREEAPNFQRNYQFFVDRFTELCHNKKEANFRCLGLRGHHALIRKTANDELQNDVRKHMDKIVPSIVFNMKVRQQNQTQQLQTTTTTSHEDIVILNETEDSSVLADTILRDLFNRAHLNNIPTCVQPILIHLDNHDKWIPDDFPKYIFSVIINSITRHNSYSIIDLLLQHLDKHFDKEEKTNIRTSIMNVIHDCMVFAAANAGAGSTMFTCIRSVLKFLKQSFLIEIKRGSTSRNNQDEQQFQTAVINGIGDFAEKLPDFQMMEIMQFIITSLPVLNQGYEENTNDSRDANLKLQLLLLKTIQKITVKKHSRQCTPSNSLEVATTYQSGDRTEITSTQTTFPHQLFDPLLKMMSTLEAEVRLIVLEILQSLVDRRQYADKLRKIRLPKDISQLGLSIETKPNRIFDIAFMKKFGHQFLTQLSQCLLMNNNNKDIFYAIYCLMNLVTLEAGDKDVLIDVIHFCFEIQSNIEQQQLSKINNHCIHALIAAYFNLMSKLHGITAFSHHVDEIVHNREVHAPYLLPSNAFRSANQENLSTSIPKECLFTQQIVVNALKSSGYDTSRFNHVVLIRANSGAPGDVSSDDSDTEEPIINKTPAHTNNQVEDISYQTIRNVLSTVESRNARDKRNLRLIDEYRTKPFEELKSRMNEKQKQSDQRIEQMLSVRYLPNDIVPITTSNGDPNMITTTTPIGVSKFHGNKFNYPALFTY